MINFAQSAFAAPQGRQPRLLSVHRLHHRMGGAEGVHLDHLALFRERGWRCAEFAMDHPDNEPSEWRSYFPARFEPETGLRSLATAARFLHSNEAREKFSALLDDFRPDVIHMHGVYHHLTPTIFKPAKDRGVPIVYTLHDYKLICPAYHFYTEAKGVCEGCHGGKQWRCLTGRCTGGSLAKDALYALDGFRQWRSGVARNAVDRFVGPCRFIVDKFAEHGFDRGRLRYVPNFFESADDASVPVGEVETLRSRHGRFVLFFGRLSAEKGVDVLIDAAAAAGAALVIVGDGPKRADLEAQARARGGEVTFTGHLKGARLWSYVEACVGVALPSVWYEIAPKSILEAQARGKPTVVTEIGGLPEMVEDGATGLVAKPADRGSLTSALRRLMSLDPEALAAMGAEAQARVNGQFTRDRYYREMSQIYAELSPACARGGAGLIRDTLEDLEGRRVETLIVGSGPAGVTLALELARKGVASVILESGLDRPGPAQALSHAEIVDPRLHDGMDIAVSRRLGGTSNLWGGRCMPLDPIDFEPRPFALSARWPIGYGDIAPHYAAACRYAHCGDAVFSAAQNDLGLGLGVADGDFALSSLERASNIPAFQKAHRQALQTSDKIDIWMGATLVDLQIGENGSLHRVRIAGQDGRRISLTVGRVVLAAGGLETTRLLLATQRAKPFLFGGADGPLGRYYAGHIIGEIADIVFADPRLAAALDFWRDGHGSFVRRRFTPSAALQRRERLPNISFWPVVPSIADPRHRSGPLSAVALALSAPGIGPRLVPEAIRKRHLAGRIDAAAHIANVAGDLPGAIGFLGGFLFHRYLSRQRIPGYFVRNRAHRYGLSYSSEQSPRPESRVTLLGDADRLGLPRLKVDYRCHAEDAAAVARAHHALAAWLARTGAGRLEYHRPEAGSAEAVAARMGHGTHQIGTARMGATRRDGVVDGDLRAFDCPNLFILSSAAFPTSGQANPTLSIVAFAVRLAETLSRERVAQPARLREAGVHAR